MILKTKIVDPSLSQSKIDIRRNLFARKIVLSLLAKMSVGRLEMTLPEGTTKVFGGADNQISAALRVFDDSMFWRCLLYGDIGLAESYIDGLCEISNIRDVLSWFLLNQENSPVLTESDGYSPLFNSFGLINKVLHSWRRNSKSNSRKNIAEHYDLGNQFFEMFLDRTMTYSSALFTDASMTLEAAQLAKFERIAAQLRIQQSDRVLEVGCGWGALSIFLAKNFGCSVTAATISKQQHEFVSDLIRRERLENLIDLRLEDYRNLTGKFDKIVSIEMIEAVGEEYIDLFIRKLDRLLAADGLLLLQMITCPDSRYDIAKANVDFIQKHIFPGALLQSVYRVSSAMRRCGDLFMVDLFDMTTSYVITLQRWQESFERRAREIRELGFDERFIRKWRYYFQYCQAGFQMRNVSVVQATYSRPNNRKLAGR
jgi:cyclopropane-fatty-acyl-phospholipid synthase